MDIPTSSLHNQYIPKKNKFILRFGFVFLFIISVGLNVYFLYFDQKMGVAVASLPQDTEKILQNSAEPPQPEIHKKEVPLTVKTAVITPAVFTVSSEETLEGKSIHSLNFKIRNSLNYSVCKIITREKGCAALSAHLGYGS